MPLDRRSLPLGQNVSQCQVNQFDRCLGAREVTFVAHRLSDLAIQRSDCVGRVDDLAHIRREGKERDDRRPSPVPARHHRGILPAPWTLLGLFKGLSGRSGTGRRVYRAQRPPPLSA